MTYTETARATHVDRAVLGGIAAVSAALLMTELALTRIFSVTMYYHFAFLAISIALFGLSASSVMSRAAETAAIPPSTARSIRDAGAATVCDIVTAV